MFLRFFHFSNEIRRQTCYNAYCDSARADSTGWVEGNLIRKDEK